jgi:multiple antibiotic resistance protein
MRIMELSALLHDRLFKDFVTLFVVINPISTIPLFITVTRHEPAETIRKTALRSVVIAAIILLTFVIIGQLLLAALDIELGAFRNAGGLVLLIIFLSMVLQSTHQPTEERKETTGRHDVAVFPLATPFIAGPGAILAAVLLTEHTLYSVPQQVGTTLVMLGVLAIQYVVLLASWTINRVLRETGTNVISRIMGLILAALSIETILIGIRTAFALG